MKQYQGWFILATLWAIFAHMENVEPWQKAGAIVCAVILTIVGAFQARRNK